MKDSDSFKLAGRSHLHLVCKILHLIYLAKNAESAQELKWESGGSNLDIAYLTTLKDTFFHLGVATKIMMKNSQDFICQDLSLSRSIATCQSFLPS